MRIIVTAVGGSGGRFLSEALHMAGHYVIGTDCDPSQLPLAISDEKHLVPNAELNTVAFMLHMGRMVKETGADLIMPQSDAEVLTLCHARSYMEAVAGPPGHLWTEEARAICRGGLPLFLPVTETVEAAQDKWASYNAWVHAGIRTPASYLLEDSGDLVCGAMWYHRRHCAGAAGALHTRSWEFASKWISEHDAWGSYIASDYCAGVNCVADLVFWRGELVAWGGREVLAWQMAHCSPTGVTGASRVTVLHLEERLREVAEAAVRALPGDPHGVFGVDTIRKDDGSYWVTEVNAGRFNAPGPALYARAGCNLADWAAVYAIGSPAGYPPPVDTHGLVTCSDSGAWAMLRGQDTPPIYLTKAEWEALCASR